MSTEMSADTPKMPKWIYVLVASVALNGLLAGLLIATTTQVKPEIVMLTDTQAGISHREPPHKMTLHRSVYDNPRGLIAHLAPERRRDVMSTAMKQLKKQDVQAPHELLMALRKSHKQTQRLLQVDTIDEQALQASLKENRVLKEKLARQGDALVLEILRQLTSKERKGAMQALQQVKRKRPKHGLKHRKPPHPEN